jgi:hypothetical protein
MALDTVQDYITEARTLLQDLVVPYRYADSELLSALSDAFMDARRLRPDMFLPTYTTLPTYATVDTTAVSLDPMYRRAFVYFMCGTAQMRDEESTEDSRAAMFLERFAKTLTSIV